MKIPPSNIRTLIPFAIKGERGRGEFHAVEAGCQEMLQSGACSGFANRGFSEDSPLIK